MTILEDNVTSVVAENLGKRRSKSLWIVQRLVGMFVDLFV